MKKMNKILFELYGDRYQLLVVAVIGVVSAIIDSYTVGLNDVNQASVGWVVAGSVVVNYLGQKSATRSANRNAAMGHELAAENMRMQNEITEKQLVFQKEEAAKLEIQKDIYRGFEFKNPYDNIENVYEDLTVNTQAAEFQMQQGDQQRANIMQDLRGAAGSSGIAGLAQALANQGTQQAQQASISIGQQEQQNQMMERKAASANDMAMRGGEASLQEMEMSRQSTLLGIQMGQTSGANAGVQQAYANQMSAGANQANMYGQQAASQYGLAAQYSENMSDSINMYAKYKM